MAKTFAYNTFNTQNLANYSLYELVFGRKPKLLLNSKTTKDIKVSGSFKELARILKPLVGNPPTMSTTPRTSSRALKVFSYKKMSV